MQLSFGTWHLVHLTIPQKWFNPRISFTQLQLLFYLMDSLPTKILPPKRASETLRKKINTRRNITIEEKREKRTYFYKANLYNLLQKKYDKTNHIV